MQRARRTGVSSFKGVEFVYSIATKVSEKMKWEPTKDSPLPNQAVFVLADRTAPRPHKNSRLKNEKTKSQEEEWDGIRYARLTIENSKVTITDLGYTTETGDRISVNSKSLVVAGRRYPLQDGDEVVFPRRARSSTEKVRSAEAQKVTVCVKFFFGLDKAKCRFMPEPSANDTGRTHLPLEAVASEPTENVPKGRPPTGIANDPLPTGVVASSTARTRAAEPSSSNSTLALFLPWNSGTRTPSTSNARPPLEPRTTTDDAVQRNPGTSSVDNTPDTPSSSTSTLFSRSSTGLSWSSSATTPAQSPRSSEHSRSPSPTARRGSGAKDTAQLSLGTSKTATDDAGRGRQPKRPTLRPGEKFTGASVLTPLKYRLMQSRSPSTVARSRSRTVNGDRPTSVLPRTRDGSLSRRPIPARLLSTPSPASTVNGRARTFGAKDQIARQVKPVSKAAAAVKTKGPPFTAVEFVSGETDEAAKNVSLKPEQRDVLGEVFDLIGRSIHRIQVEKYCYGRLSFKPPKVTLTRVSSATSIQVQPKSHEDPCFELPVAKPHPLEDGDKITFRASEDGKTSIRFQLNFVNGPAAQDCPILFRTTHDLAPPILQHTQNTSLSRKTPSPVAPSAPLPSMAPEPTDVLADEDKNTHLEEQSHKPDRSTAIFTNHRAQATTSKAPTTSQTELEGRVRLPWVEGESMLGFGFDALTGEFKVNSVFNHPVNLVETSKTAQSEIVIEHLKWQQVKEFQDEFEISVGATVNVPFPRIGANAKIAKILSENTAVSRIIMQYTVNVSFSAEYISDADVQLKEELHNLDPLEFRARYGDYYIAGYQRGYSCRVIAVCQTTEKTVTERLEREAKIFVENCFTGKLGSDRSKLATETFSLLTFEVHTEGCLLDTANMAGADIQEKVMQLKQSNHAGVERIAFLNHYSTLRRNLSRRLHVSGEMFHRAHVMRDAYAYLRMCRLHPALQEFYSDRRALDEVLKDFEKHRKDLVQMTQDEQRTRTIDALHQNLHSSKNTVETYIQRYDFMSTVTNMDKRIIAHDPTVIDGSDLRYRWECGKTGGVKKGGEPESPSVVCFGGHDAFEITWKSPWAPGHRIRRERVDMTFSTRYDHDIPVRPPNPNLKSKKPPVEAIHPGAYDYHLANQGPVFILGWQLSCSWPRNRGKPTIKAGHPLNHILSDQLRISVDISRATQWECKVTYVEKSSHDFPQLMPPRGQ